jgi:hypothetical protein
MAETSASVPLLWEKEAVPGIADSEFKNYISLENHAPFHPAETQCRAWEDAPNPEAWSAFGDRGTTAMVSAYGDLIQFGNYTGQGRSGMFTADRRSMSEPYLVESRTEKLQTWSRATLNESYGLNIHEVILESGDEPPSDSSSETSSSAASSAASSKASPEEIQIFPYATLPQLEYVNYRWPRFQSGENSSRSNITTQWIVHDGVVMQQVRVLNTSPDELCVKFTMDLKESMWIRDLDHMDSAYNFNESYDNHAQLFGPHNYSWVLTRELEPAQAIDKTNYEDTGETSDKTETNNEAEFKGESTDQTVKPMSNQMNINTSLDAENGRVAIIVSVLQDGQLVKMEPPTNRDSSLSLICKTTLKGVADGSSIDPETRQLKSPSNSTEVVVAYKMIILPSSKADWKNFIIPASAMNVDKILASEPFNDTLNISLLSGKQNPDPKSNDGNAQGSSNINLTSGDKGPVPDLDQDSNAKEPQKQPQPSGLPDQAEYASSHIEFVVRRQLEHILSNCSIPLKPPRLYEDGSFEAYWTGEAVPIALTCGDFSFHRITSSASL